MTDKELAEEWVKEHWSKNVTELYNTESFQRVKGTSHFYDTNLSEAFLAGLKAGRPQWHDLRKDPNDLPDEGTYSVVWQNARGYKEIMQMNYEEDDEEKLHWVDGDQDCWDDDIIAWCEIPTFDKE